MAPLPDPTDTLTGDDLATYRAMADRRGEGALGDVYVRMFNDPTVARLVGDLGGHLRYAGSLPGDVRELVILHLARTMALPYEWVHHQHPARAAGLDDDVIAAVGEGRVPDGLRDDQRAALAAADAVFELRSVPADAQATLAAEHGIGSVVELAALVGLYRLIGGVVAGFDVAVEPPFAALVPAWAGERRR